MARTPQRFGELFRRPLRLAAAANAMAPPCGILWLAVAALAVTGRLTASGTVFAQETNAVLAQQLADLPYKILFESYDGDNWELFEISADGSDRRNITNTKDVHELYPQVSPDGSKIAFLVDTHANGTITRSLYLMNRDGSGRKKITDGGREPTWSHDSRKIAFPKQEFSRFNVKDYVSKYLFIYDTETGETTRHGNELIEHLYVPSWSADDKWIFSTVHGGMGFGHAILGIEADGRRVVDMKVPGCRPCISPDGKRLTWSSDDHTISVADIVMTDEGPQAQNVRVVHKEPKMHLYHPDFSPDGQFICFSMGPGGRCAADGPGTQTEVAEMIGVRGPWDLYVQQVDGQGAPVRVTYHPELSNKESEWAVVP